MYAVRLSLCLEMLRYACDSSDKQAVGIESVKGALELVEYFKRTAIKIRSMVPSVDPLEKLPRDKQDLYKELPDKFKTGDGVKVAGRMGIAERTFKNFIKNKDLFTNPKRGYYEKKL